MKERIYKFLLSIVVILIMPFICVVLIIITWFLFFIAFIKPSLIEIEID